MGACVLGIARLERGSFRVLERLRLFLIKGQSSLLGLVKQPAPSFETEEMLF